MKHWGPAPGSGTPQEDAQRAALSVLQNFDDSLEEDTYAAAMSGRSGSSPNIFGEPKTRSSSFASSTEGEEASAATPVSTSTPLSAEAEAEVEAAAEAAVEAEVEAEVATPATPVEAEEEAAAAAPLAAAGAWLATLPPRVAVEAPPNGHASSAVDDEGAVSDFVYDGAEETDEPPSRPKPEQVEPPSRLAAADHSGARLLHTVAAFTSGEQLRSWTMARPLPALIRGGGRGRIALTRNPN